jgi:sirohydrochlorin ferrochelatase
LIAGACHQVVDCFQSKPPTSAASQAKEWSGEFGSIGFAMVGRGTSDSFALDQMRYFTELRVASAKTPSRWVQTGFFAGGKPDVDQLLIQAAVAECDTLVIQPHLLFEGELVRQLREKVAITQRKTARSRWLVTPTLGADPHLAEAFFKLATETLRMTMPSNSSITHVATDGLNS